MTCYYILDVKTLQILSLHFVPTLQSAVYILCPVCSLLSAFCSVFIVYSRVLGNAEKNAENHHIQWADSQEMAGCRLSFDSIPFQIVGVKVSECQNGPDRSKALKRKEAQKRPKRDVSMHNN